MRRLAKPLAALAFLALICLFPDEAKRAAWDSMRLWANSLAPSLLPFLIALSALSGEEACALYRRMLGRVLPRLGLAPEMAGTAVIGLICGSPAGAASLNRLCTVAPLDRNQLLRCAWFASGASPAFLLTAVARGMLGAPELAWGLVLAQWGGQALCLGLFRRLEPLSGRAQTERASSLQEGAVWQAVRSLLTIGGYMAFFAVLSGTLCALLGTSTALRALISAGLELAGGCQAIAEAPWPLTLRACLISACASLGGLSSCLQAHAFLRPLGIPLRAYLAGKAVQAALTAWLMRAMMGFRLPAPAFDPPTLGALLALLTLLLLFIGVRRSHRAAQ